MSEGQTCGDVKLIQCVAVVNGPLRVFLRANTELNVRAVSRILE